MSKATVGQGRVTASDAAVVAAMNNRVIEPRDVAESICAIAYMDGRTGGVYAAAPDVLSSRLHLPQQAIDAALIVAGNCGWLRQRDGQIELTAAGLYIAKLSLKLPT